MVRSSKNDSGEESDLQLHLEREQKATLIGSGGLGPFIQQVEAAADGTGQAGTATGSGPAAASPAAAGPAAASPAAAGPAAAASADAAVADAPKPDAPKDTATAPTKPLASSLDIGTGLAATIHELGVAEPWVDADVWKALPDQEKAALARRLVEQHIDGRKAMQSAITWTTTPDAAWFAAVDESKRAALAEEILKRRAGAAADQLALGTAQARLNDERVKLLEQGVAGATELVNHLRRWRKLSQSAIRILVIALIVSAVFSAWVLWLLASKVVNAAEASLVIFVLALVAISPVVLLLLERPLKGMDEWRPGAADPPAKADPAKAEPAK